MNNNMDKTTDSVTIETPPAIVGQSARGKYKFEVLDKNGTVYDSGDWKPNLILDCGLDKLADMPWAQTFQWCVAGTDPTPTVEKFEHTRLKVTLDLFNTCDNPEPGYVFPDGRKLECWEDEMPAIRVRATAGCREAPELPLAYDPAKKKNIKNVPDNAEDHLRSFGKVTEIGSTLYLRDQNLQFKVIGSCPQYLVEPLQATAEAVALSGFCSTLGAIGAPSGSGFNAITPPTRGPNGIFTEAYDSDMDGQIDFVDRGLVATHRTRIGQGYVGLGATLGPGDPEVPLFDSNGNRDPRSGIRVDYPQGRGGKLKVTVATKIDSTGVQEGDLELIDQGDGYGFSDDCDDGTPLITFESPAYNAHWGPWQHDDDNSWNKQMYVGQYTQRYSGVLRSAGRQGPIRYGHQFAINHEKSAWDGTMWSTNGNLANLTKEVYEYCFGDGTETITDASFPMGYGANMAVQPTARGGRFMPGTGATPTTSELTIITAQIMLMHFLPFAAPTGHHWYNSPSKIKWVEANSLGYDRTNVQTRDSVTYFMRPSNIGPGAGQVPSDDWKHGYTKYHTNTQNIGVGNIIDEIRACDNSDGLPMSSGEKFSDANDTLMNKIDAQWTNHANLIAAIKANELGLIDLHRLQQNLDPSPVYLPVESIKNLGFKHEAYHNNPDGPQPDPGGMGGELQKIIESWTAINGAFSLGHFEPNTEYDFLTRRTGHDSYFLYQSNVSTYSAYGAEKNLFHRMNGSAEIEMAVAFSLVTNNDGVVRWIKLDPSTWVNQLINDQLVAQTNDRHKGVLEDIINNGLAVGRLYAGNFYQASDPRMITPALPQRRPAVATAEITDCKVTKVVVTEEGRGYTLGDTPNVVMTAPMTERAEFTANIDQATGWITSFTTVNAGKGYSCSKPAKINFPRPPIQPVRAWDLLVKPLKTYENINNNYSYKRLEAGIQDDIFREQNCDIYHTQQTYLGDGKSHFSQGTVTSGPDDGGHYSQSKVRCGPCHYVDFNGPTVNGVAFRAGNKNHPGTYTIDEDDLFDNNLTALKHVDPIYHNQYKTHGWYLTGTDPETNSLYCGTDFLSTGNQVIMTRTFDFYIELQPVTYTEIGFKDAPASRELFSRIVFDDPVRLRAGQYLRVSYQLLLTMEPGPTARYREVPSEGTWVNGRREWIDYNTGDRNVSPVLTGYECIQGNGIAVVGGDGVATPYDITGVANEPYACGTYFLGPQYGYVNRWKNGDTRLSFPTREYNRDINNPWIHGGDQHNPPDWAIRHFRSPTQNYMPRNFRSFLEWPSFQKKIPHGFGSGTFGSKNAPDMHNVTFPPGPESTLERDAFSHWYVPWFSNGNETTGTGHITWTNHVQNYEAPSKDGRWDFHVTKPYLREVYPHLMRGGLNGINRYGSHGMPSPAIPEAWIQKYEQGHFLGTDGVNNFFSGKGVYPSPVIEYDGQAGALHDPTTTSTTNKNPLSHLGGMGLITRATFLARNPYTGSTDLAYGAHGKDSFSMILPHNNGHSGQVWGSTVPTLTPSLWHWKDCGYMNPPIGQDRTWLDWQSVNGGINAIWTTNNRKVGPWCWHDFVDKIRDDKVFGPFDLIRRQKDRWTMHNRYNLNQRYPTRQSYGGGFSTMAAWKTWTHTPLINVINNWRGGTPVSVPGMVNPAKILPDTVGNWAQSEVIPVAGCSAFITTANRDFGIVGSYLNLSHTVFGAVSGLSAEPVHDFGLGQPISTAARGAGWNGRKISLEEAVDTDGNGYVRSFEVPTYLNDYVRGDHKREKYAEWETSFANLTGVCAMGLGPTSTTLQPIEMTDAARFNTYVFKFGTPTGLVNRFDNLTTFKLKSTFLHTWYRDLT